MKIVIATDKEDYSYVILDLKMKVNLTGFISKVRTTSTNLVAIVAYHGSIVTMTMVSNNTFLCFKRNFVKKNFV